jgi:hypothetical protein
MVGDCDTMRRDYGRSNERGARQSEEKARSNSTDVDAYDEVLARNGVGMPVAKVMWPVSSL